MDIYLAASYRRHDELRQYARDLEHRGHRVTSRWLFLPADSKDTGMGPVAYARLHACVDRADLARAQACIAFTEPPWSHYSRGGRHVELGMALAWGKDVTIIGPAENIFCALPEVRQYPTWAQFLASLPPLPEDAPSPPEEEA